MGDQLVDANRVERREDIFFLTADEIDALLSGVAMFPDQPVRWLSCAGRRTRRIRR